MSGGPHFKKIALIGFGLIGGSIARAAREQGLAGEIVTTARSAKTRARVMELGIVDRVVETNAEAAKDADLVILCIPVGACGPVAQEIAPYLKPGAIVSDVGSVKGAVVRDMAPHLPASAHFVPAHPVAGTEHSGPDSGFAELFINRWCILTPPDGTDPKAVEKLRAFWTALGARVEIMTPDHHDLVLAITSHLPHLIAYTIVGTADELGQVTSSEVMKFSAGGFRDFTRIAASDPTCGATYSSPTRRRCWKCSAPSTRTFRSSPVRSAAATARRCSSISPVPARSAAASSRSARIRRRPTSAVRTRIWRRRRSRIISSVAIVIARSASDEGIQSFRQRRKRFFDRHCERKRSNPWPDTVKMDCLSIAILAMTP